MPDNPRILASLQDAQITWARDSGGLRPPATIYQPCGLKKYSNSKVLLRQSSARSHPAGRRGNARMRGAWKLVAFLSVTTAIFAAAGGRRFFSRRFWWLGSYLRQRPQS